MKYLQKSIFFYFPKYSQLRGFNPQLYKICELNYFFSVFILLLFVFMIIIISFGNLKAINHLHKNFCQKQKSDQKHWLFFFMHSHQWKCVDFMFLKYHTFMCDYGCHHHMVQFHCIYFGGQKYNSFLKMWPHLTFYFLYDFDLQLQYSLLISCCSFFILQNIYFIN